MSAGQSDPENDQNDPLEDLKKKRDKLFSPTSVPSESSIFRVHRQVRGVNPKAYTPRLISIGPYHHDKQYLKEMETHKVRYFANILQRNEGGLKQCSSKFMEEEGKIRNCYAEKGDMSQTRFVKIMLLDGCFVVELIRKWVKRELQQVDGDDDNEDDDLFKQNLNLTIVAHDMLLLENQLPFFVLNQLFQMTRDVNEERQSFADTALRFFSGIMPGPGLVCGAEYSVEDPAIKHLLDLVHANWGPTPSVEEKKGCESQCIVMIKKLLLDNSQSEKSARIMKFMLSATELKELGITFKTVKANILLKKDTIEGEKLFDIKFDKRKGIMCIPALTINHDTERIFRNLIAYEQFNQGFLSIVMDYTRLMDCLINSESDVALLTENGIIENGLGSNQAVADMFNKLNNYVYLSKENFYYSRIFNDVKEYYNGRLNQLKLKLKTSSSQTPWDWVLISIIAAAFLLLLTVAQTVIALLDYLNI